MVSAPRLRPGPACRWSGSDSADNLRGCHTRRAQLRCTFPARVAPRTWPDPSRASRTARSRWGCRLQTARTRGKFGRDARRDQPSTNASPWSARGSRLWSTSHFPAPRPHFRGPGSAHARESAGWRRQNYCCEAASANPAARAPAVGLAPPPRVFPVVAGGAEVGSRPQPGSRKRLLPQRQPSN